MTRLHELQAMLVEESARPEKQEPTRLENILFEMVSEANSTTAFANNTSRALLKAVAVWQRRAMVLSVMVWLLTCTLAFMLTR